MKNAPKNDKSVGAWYLARATHITQLETGKMNEEAEVN